jgi:1-aminocyclopropane-1-carboxylate deaminase/D-cysteine desulfhydrase-like pyridoxal-dependent ACC family enzyme
MTYLRPVTDGRAELEKRAPDLLGPHETYGRYPTPVERLAALSTERSALWVKRDDVTSDLYGGNKVRKLEYLVAEAKRRGKTRLLTIGAAGSHHVLATALFGARAGLGVDAVVIPQRYTAHVGENLRADLAAGATLHPTWGYTGVPFAVVRAWTPRSYFVPMGGSNVVGSMGYVAAAFELAAQVRAGELPEPDVAVVTLGSGGTVAGLAAGFALAGLATRVVAVVVAGPALVTVLMARSLAGRCFRRGGGTDRRALRGRIVPTVDYLGAGYGEPSWAGDAATERAKAHGLALDSTYTAKCFAAALDLIESGAHANVLYWHTLSSAPMAPLLARAPAEADLDRRLQRLLVGR